MSICESAEIRFGGWHNGDNHKPGRGWYFICSCGHVGLGQLLPASAQRQWKKHVQKERWRMPP
jgi:hypothetical protein